MEIPFAIDYQMVLVCIGVCVASALLIYFTTVFSMREKPYEEILAEQKRRQEEFLEKAKDNKKQEKKKKYKKGKDRSGKTEEIGTDDEKHEDHVDRGREGSVGPKAVHLQLEPKVIDEEIHESDKKKQKSNKISVKPILINRDEKSVVLPDAEVPELFHAKVPKDDLELKHEQDRRRSSSASESHELAKQAALKADVSHFAECVADEENKEQEVKKGKKNNKKKVKEPAEENVVVEHMESTVVAKQMMTNGSEPQPPKQKKKSKSAGSVEGDAIRSTIQAATLNDVDVKNLIEALVIKYSNADSSVAGMPDMDWTKKGQKNDPLSQIKKELETKQQIFEEECRKTQAAVLKIQELNGERQKLASIVRQTQDQMNNQMQEIEAMKARHVMEMKSLHATLEATKVDSHKQVQRVLEENKKLQEAMAQSSRSAASGESADELRQKVKVLEDALNQNVLRYNSVDNAKKNLEIKVKQYEEQSQRMDANMREYSAMAQRYNELTEEIRKYEARCNSLSHCLEQEKSAKLEELKGLDAKFREAENTKLRLEAQLKEAGHNCHQKDLELKSQLEEIERLKKEISVRHENMQSKADSDRANKILVDNEGMVNQLKLSTELQKEKIVELEAEKKNLQLMIEDLQINKKASGSAEDADSSSVSRMVIELSEKSNQLDIVTRDYNNLKAQHAALLSTEKGNGDSKTSAESLKETESLREELKKRELQVSELNKKLDSFNSLQEKHAESQRKIEDLQRNDFVMVQRQEELKKNYEARISELQTKLNAAPQDKPGHVTVMKERLGELEAAEKKWMDHEEHLSGLADKMTSAEAEIESLRHKLLERGRRSEEQGTAEVKLRAAEQELGQLREQLKESSDKLSEIAARESTLKHSEAKTAEVEKQLAGLEQSLQALKQKESEWKDVEEKYEILRKREAEFVELEQKMKECEEKWAEKDVRFNELLDKESKVMSQLEGLCGKEEELQENLEKLKQAQERILQAESQLKQKAEDCVKLEKRCAELEQQSKNAAAAVPQVDSSADELKALQSQMLNKDGELKRLNAELTRLQAENTDLKSNALNTSTNVSENKQTKPLKEVTVIKQVQEKSSWDMSRLVLDLETKITELEILQMLLAQKEENIKALEKDKASLSRTVDNMKSAAAKPPQTSDETKRLEKELTESKQGQCKLESQVDHYKNVLADTERMLDDLQKSVESEDLKWQKRLHTMEEQLSHANEEIKHLQQELIGHKGSTELTNKTEALERRIDEVESEKLEALLELSQLRSSYDSVTSELLELRKANTEHNSL